MTNDKQKELKESILKLYKPILDHSRKWIEDGNLLSYNDYETGVGIFADFIETLLQREREYRFTGKELELLNKVLNGFKVANDSMSDDEITDSILTKLL